jgi:hypothetical protein
VLDCLINYDVDMVSIVSLLFVAFSLEQCCLPSPRAQCLSLVSASAASTEKFLGSLLSAIHQPPVAATLQKL